MRQLLLLVLLIAQVALGQSVTFQNMGTSAQTRWCRFMLPKTVTASLASDGTIDNLGWPYCLANSDFGDQQAVWVKTTLSAGQKLTIPLSDFNSTPAPASGPTLGWLQDVPADATVELRIVKDGGSPIVAPYYFVGVVESSARAAIWKYEVYGLGFYSAIYMTIAHETDIFDIQGYVTWSDRAGGQDYDCQSNLRLQHGEEHVLYLDNALGQDAPAAGPTQLYDGVQFTGQSVPFFGAIIAQPDLGQNDPARLAVAQAALTGPVVGLGDLVAWDGAVGPHRPIIPTGMPGPSSSGFNYSTIRDQMDQRPWANTKNSGQTGDQGIWGSFKAFDLFNNGDPEFAQYLRYNSTDYFARGCNHLNAQSFPLYPSLTDGLLTYQTNPYFRLYGNAWGYGNNQDPPWGWAQGRAWLDDQHRGNLFMPTALIVNGDWIVKDMLWNVLAMDSRSIRLRTGQIDAARAVGRKLSEWAYWWCGADVNQRTWLETLADTTEDIIENRAPMTVSGPVKCLEYMNATDSKNPLRPNYECWVPWQSSFVCDGLNMWADNYLRAGNATKATDYLTDSIKIGQATTNYGIIEDPTNTFTVITYCKYNANGAAQPPSWYTYPASWFTTHLNPVGQEGVVGGISMAWYSGAIFTADNQGNAKGTRALTDLRTSAGLIGGGPFNRSLAEWLIR